MRLVAWETTFMVAVGSVATAAVPQEPEPEPEAVVRPVGSSEVTVSDFMMVDIVAQNDYVTNILSKLAIQGRRNIVPSAATERLVTANIYRVPFEDALNGLLAPNGLGFVERDEFIFVYTADELAEMQVGAFGPVTKMIHLDYLRAVDARDYVIKMLSRKGHIEITKDFPDGDGGGDAAAAVGSFGGQVTSDDSIYTPEEDEYDLRNAIIVHDLIERVERIEAFLKSIDTRPAQILLEASIISTSITENNAFGIDFATLDSENFVDFFTAPIVGNPLGFKEITSGMTTTAVEPHSGFVLSTPGNTGEGDATIRAGYVGDVGFFLRALDQVTDVTLLSNPKVMTLNRQRTKVYVGKRVGYFETTTVENQVNQSLKYLDTGIVLDVRPFVLQDGRIRLELSPKVSEVDIRKVLSPNGFLQEIPDEVIQTITTSVLVPVGHTAVLGGLFREDTTRSRNQVPFFGDLPLVGALFRGRDESLGKNEVIFLIKPTVLEDDALIEAGLAGAEYGENVRVGSRLGLLFWSRERGSARLNLQAERLLATGKVKQARSKLRRSLGMFPQQPDVIRALERLDREEMWIRDLSYVNQLIDEEYARMQDGEEE